MIKALFPGGLQARPTRRFVPGPGAPASPALGRFTARDSSHPLLDVRENGLSEGPQVPTTSEAESISVIVKAPSVDPWVEVRGGFRPVEFKAPVSYSRAPSGQVMGL